MVGYPDLEKRIRELEETVRILQEENQQLRYAARAFGDLAERLNVSLDAERRKAADRRRFPRWTEDRRRPMPSADGPSESS
jgi:predicted RNase H-like nuclease (RuvC/YqgF family)